MMGIIGLLIGASIFGYGFDFFMTIAGISLLAIGVLLFVSTTREKRRIHAAVVGRDGISVDAISSEAQVSFERANDYLMNMIASGFLRGRIVDGIYYASMQAEMIDAKTVRCPFCETELELPDEL